MLAVPMDVSDIICFTNADASLGNVQEAAVKANAKLDKAVMHCPRGPEDNRDQKGQAVEKLAGQRLKRTEAGLSVRVGCGVRFAARRQPDTPELTEILYYQWDHSEACRVSNPTCAITVPQFDNLLQIATRCDARTC